MIHLRCDQALISLMARRDGEAAPLTAEDVDTHLAACSTCRAEASADAALDERLMAASSVRPPAPALWAALRLRLKSLPAGRNLVVVAALVFALRAGVLVRYPSVLWMGSLLGVAVIVLGFLILRENPFRIHANLTRTLR